MIVETCKLKYLIITCCLLSLKFLPAQENREYESISGEFLKFEADTFIFCKTVGGNIKQKKHSGINSKNQVDTISFGLWKYASDSSFIILNSFRNKELPYLIKDKHNGCNQSLVKIEDGWFGAKDSMYFQFVLYDEMPSLKYCLSNSINSEIVFCGEVKGVSEFVVLPKSRFNIDENSIMLFSLDIYPNLKDWRWYGDEGNKEINTYLAQLPVFFSQKKGVNHFKIDVTQFNEFFFRERILKGDYVLNYNDDSLVWDGVVFR